MTHFLDRSRWISDITVALGEAERLLSLLEADGNHPAEAIRLRTRVQLVRSELELLRRAIRKRASVKGSPWPNIGTERE